MACLNYHPSRVLLNGTDYDRVDLFKIIEKMIEKTEDKKKKSTFFKNSAYNMN